jgi:tetratricopeptide (TPR) repeat protein
MHRWLLGALFILCTAVLLVPKTCWATSCAELVQQAELHETAHEDDIAARRYTEALTLDSTCHKAYLGLATLRVRQGDGREAERVAAALLDHLPTMRSALAVLGRAKWLQGKHDEAEHDLEAYADSADDPRAVLRELAGWYGSEGKAPAQLAVYRRLLALDPDSKETRAMVKALTIVVSHADPVSAPAFDTPIRRTIRQLSQNAR